ncbi:MAG: helix-turn-helix domain-containing protein [Gammaproteobacteria bacterium]
MPKSLRTPRQERLQALLAQVRKARKLTQSDVAERLDRPQSFVAKYEGGERRLDVVEFVEVAEALETDPCALLSNLLYADEPLPPAIQGRRSRRTRA